MNKTKLAPLAATVLAMLFSCSSDENGSVDKYEYCIFADDKLCLAGPFSSCEIGGRLSNSCPYDNGLSISSSSSSSNGLSYIQSSSSRNTQVNNSSSSSNSIQTNNSSSSNGSFSSSSSSIVSSSSLYSSSSLLLSSSSNTIVYGTPVTYQGETYQTVVIGTQTWFARNLNYNVSGSACYNCTTYGRLYDWATAMDLPSSCNSNTSICFLQEKHQGICPNGWHIPNKTDWNILINYVDGTGGDDLRSSPTAGTKLKATIGWNSYSGVPNGTDEFGFAALPGGVGYSGGIVDVGSGSYGYWWSSAMGINAYDSYYLGMSYDRESAWYSFNSSSTVNVGWYSVRCVKD